jgi:hypothetical protein
LYLNYFPTMDPLANIICNIGLPHVERPAI